MGISSLNPARRLDTFALNTTWIQLSETAESAEEAELLGEDPMIKRKGKSVSFDAMVKFFMQNYSIPTKKDIDQLAVKIDRLEKVVQSANFGRRGRASHMGRGKPAGGNYPVSASDTVLEIIKRFKGGIGFADIRAQTGYSEKKLRNIIYRLGKQERIVAKRRGIYVTR